MPKPLLPTQNTLIQPLATDRHRKHFRLRVGQRYWRDPVPDDIVETLQRPLRDVLDRSARRVAMVRNFSAWLGQRLEDGRVLIIAIAAPGRLRDAERDWREIMSLLRDSKPAVHDLIEPEESGAYSADDVSLGVWLESFKFDFDQITYGSRADDEHAAPPA